MSRFRSVSEVAASFCRGGRFRPVSEIEATVSERRSISSSFRNLEGLSWEGVAFSMFQKSRHRSGEGVDFVVFQKSRSSSRRCGRLRHVSQMEASVRTWGSFLVVFRKTAVGRAVVWTVGRMAKTWQRRCTCVAHVANVNGFKAAR